MAVTSSESSSRRAISCGALILTGKLKIGLITFQSVEQEIGEALGIPEERRGHFWAERGSNKKEDCDILLVIGTPTLPPDELARLARALYADDPTPIDEATVIEDGVRVYLDPRMRHLDTYSHQCGTHAGRAPQPSLAP